MTTREQLYLAPSSWVDCHNMVFDRLLRALPRRLLIGVDGRDGSGKSGLAAWLSWQLNVLSVDLDLFLVPDTIPLKHRVDDIKRVVDGRYADGTRSSLIVSGILHLDVLAKAGRKPDVLIFVERAWNDGNLSTVIDPYLRKRLPHALADIHVKWAADSSSGRLPREPFDAEGFDEVIAAERAQGIGQLSKEQSIPDRHEGELG